MGYINATTELVVAFSNFAWPLTLIGMVVWFRKSIAELFGVIKRQINLGASVKYGDLELNGIKIENAQEISGDIFEIVGADQELLAQRDKIYAQQKNIFLVHRAIKTTEFHDKNGLPIFDISLYLITHKTYGALNDVKYVEYYLGKHFRTPLSKYGMKFVVKNSKDGFAVRTTAYGPGLCEARIYFHDGTIAIVNRYMDFEGSGYKYDPNDDGNIRNGK